MGFFVFFGMGYGCVNFMFCEKGFGVGKLGGGDCV